MDPKPARYTPTAVALHWIVALLIIGNLAFGLYVAGLPISPAKLRTVAWHKWVGVTILLVAAVRLAWRLRHPAPALPARMAPWERQLANGTHVLLYVLFFAAPLTGWLFSSAAGFPVVYLGLVQLPDLVPKHRELADVLRAAHKWINYTMAAVIVLHAAAAIKHHVRDRDDVLVRMIPFLKPRTP
jgi:cytochrome b561